MSRNPFLISPADLGEHLGRDSLSIVDASWYLPEQRRAAHAEFKTAHVPGAVFFDQDAIVDPGSPLPHALPSPEVFAEAVGTLGISDTDTIVVYDGVGLFTAPRVWWMFRTFGAKDVRILDGGFPAWRAAEMPLEDGPGRWPRPGRFNASYTPEAVASLADVKAAVAAGDVQIADARPRDRFSGKGEEPRPGVRAGHIPGSSNLPFVNLAEDGRLKEPDRLRVAFREAGIDPSRPVITSCGSGVTAAVINLALETLGARDARLYDGSWTEWGAAPDTDVNTLP